MNAIELPALSRVMSPNYSSRGGAKVRLIVIHDCEGSYSGSIAWFSQAKSRVSAHIVLNEAGTAATQCVAFANKAWHACSFNPVSEGIEAAGYAVKGLAAAEWQALANITAYRLRANGLPPVWSRDGSGEGYCQHRDLGSAGGGHTDITSDPSTWVAFQTMVEEAYKQPMPDGWGSTGALPPPLPVGFVPHSGQRHDNPIGSLEWVQLNLNAMNINSPSLSRLVVDGLDGPDTRFAVCKFQRANGLVVDGDAGPKTCAAILKAVMVLPTIRTVPTGQTGAKPMTESPTVTSSPATVAAPARVVPTPTQPVRIPWQDWLEQFLIHETPLIENVAQVGVTIAAGAIPGGVGTILLNLVGPTIVKQVVDGVLSTIEGPLSNPNLAIAIPANDMIATMAANVLNTAVPTFAGKAGDLLDGWIKTAVASLGR